MTEQEVRVCSARGCQSGAWDVRPHSDVPQLWYITSQAEASSWLIAAHEPVCPRCGAALVTLLGIEGGCTTADMLDPGPVLEWLHTLAWDSVAANTGDRTTAEQ